MAMTSDAQHTEQLLQGQGHCCERCSGEVIAACKCVNVECESCLCYDCLKDHNKWPAYNDHVVIRGETRALSGGGG